MRYLFMPTWSTIPATIVYKRILALEILTFLKIINIVYIIFSENINVLNIRDFGF